MIELWLRRFTLVALSRASESVLVRKTSRFILRPSPMTYTVVDERYIMYGKYPKRAQKGRQKTWVYHAV